MLYVILAAVVAALLMMGTIRVQHANNVSIAAERNEALAANKSLAASIETVRVSCKKSSDTLGKMKVGQDRRIVASKAAMIENEKLAAAQRPTIDKLTTVAHDPIAGKGEQCGPMASGILRDYVFDSLRP